MRASHMRWFVMLPTFASAFLLVLHVFYLLVWPPQAITDVVLTLYDQRIQAGGVVRYRVEICKHVDSASEIHYGLVGLDDTSHYFDAGAEWGTAPKGCFQQEQHVHIPEDVPPGKYLLQVQAVMRINALRTDVYKLVVGEICVEEK